MEEKMEQQSTQDRLPDPDEMYVHLENRLRALGHSLDLDRIRAAYEMAKRGHEGQKRKDGSPYLTHCVATAEIAVDFGLDEDDFLVLMMFDSNSYVSRKNPGAAIDAFREAYGDQPERVKLVIKINNPREEDVAFVEEHIGGKASYLLITERMEKKKLNSLIRLCDVFISLHRAEGFGLVMAEAMALGTPAVATGWSANTEFMTEDAACPVKYKLIPVAGGYQFDNGRMEWADPDVHHAAEYLRRLRDDPEYYRGKAENGRRFIMDKLSMERCAETMKKRMSHILQ